MLRQKIFAPIDWKAILPWVSGLYFFDGSFRSGLSASCTVDDFAIEDMSGVGFVG